MNDILIDNIPGAPPPEVTPTEGRIEPKVPDPTCTPVPTNTNTHRQVDGVENARGQAYGKATGLYNKHRKCSDHWNPSHPFRSAHDFHLAQSFSQQTKTWIDQHPRRGPDNFKIESFQSEDTLQKLLSELVFGLGDDSWIEDDTHMFGTFYHRDIIKCIQCLLAHLTFQAHLDFVPKRLTDFQGRRIYSEMNSCDWWGGTPDQLPSGPTIVPFIGASDMTHLTNVSGNQHAWPLNR